MVKIYFPKSKPLIISLSSLLGSRPRLANFALLTFFLTTAHVQKLAFQILNKRSCQRTTD